MEKAQSQYRQPAAKERSAETAVEATHETLLRSLDSVVRTLSPLNGAERQRILRTVCILLKIEV